MPRSQWQIAAQALWVTFPKKIRDHVLNNMRVDLEDIEADGPTDEDYPGEHAERVKAYRTAIMVLGGDTNL